LRYFDTNTSAQELAHQRRFAQRFPRSDVTLRSAATGGPSPVDRTGNELKVSKKNKAVNNGWIKQMSKVFAFVA